MPPSEADGPEDGEAAEEAGGAGVAAGDGLSEPAVPRLQPQRQAERALLPLLRLRPHAVAGGHSRAAGEWGKLGLSRAREPVVGTR